ncbi:MAG: hypothetical protein M3305_01970, partial [Actinomycetota bacterium]|nr:hypothetical protein [Actinomycetota bacterium]
LKRRRYRTLTVLDDGHGIPTSHRDLVFEAGVTTRHLNPVMDPHGAPHGAGLSLYHIKKAAVEATVQSTAYPTSIRVTFDTHVLPERALQSASRPSRSNLLATLQDFAAINPTNLYYGPPARILSTLLHSRIVQDDGKTEDLVERAGGLGLEVSSRTIQRIRRGEIGAVSAVSGGHARRGEEGRGIRREARGGPVLVVGERERAEIEAILRRAARASYLEFEEIQLESRPGEVAIRGLVYEPEEEYE